MCRSACFRPVERWEARRRGDSVAPSYLHAPADMGRLHADGRGSHTHRNALYTQHYLITRLLGYMFECALQALPLDPHILRRPGIRPRACTHQPTCAATLEHLRLQQLFDVALARLTANEINRRGAVRARAECRWRDCGATAAADADYELANPSDESRSRFVEVRRTGTLC